MFFSIKLKYIFSKMCYACIDYKISGDQLYLGSNYVFEFKTFSAQYIDLTKKTTIFPALEIWKM